MFLRHLVILYRFDINKQYKLAETAHPPKNGTFCAEFDPPVLLCSPVKNL